MTVIERSALLRFTPQQLFELVNNIDDYPRFLPWCRKSQIIHQDETTIEASLDIAYSGIHKQFTTRNTLKPYQAIEIQLVNGPFRELNGLWTFTPLEEHGCQIQLRLEFQLAGHWFDRLFEPIFHQMANSMVDLFSKRAVELYENH